MNKPIPASVREKIEKEADRYATGNHRASFPDTNEKKAHIAGAEFGFSLCQEQLEIAVEALKLIKSQDHFHEGDYGFQFVILTTEALKRIASLDASGESEELGK